MTESQPAPEDLIERARQIIDDEVLTRTGRSVGDLASGHVARALAAAGLLADPEQNAEQHAERLDRALWLWAEEKWRHEQLLAQRQQWWDAVGREKAALTEQRNLAVWLHAEASWFIEQKQRELGMLHRQWFGARKMVGKLSFRIAAALAELTRVDEPMGVCVEAARAVLQPDAATEPLSGLERDPDVPSPVGEAPAKDGA